MNKGVVEPFDSVWVLGKVGRNKMAGVGWVWVLCEYLGMSDGCGMWDTY